MLKKGMPPCIAGNWLSSLLLILTTLLCLMYFQHENEYTEKALCGQDQAINILQEIREQLKTTNELRGQDQAIDILQEIREQLKTTNDLLQSILSTQQCSLQM